MASRVKNGVEVSTGAKPPMQAKALSAAQRRDAGRGKGLKPTAANGVKIPSRSNTKYE